MKALLLTLFLCSMNLFAQVTGTVFEQEASSPIYGAKIIASNGQKTMSDLNGMFSIAAPSFPLTLIFSAQTMENDTLIVDGPIDLKVILHPPFQALKTIVVTSGRRSQNIEEVPISMEILKPKLIDNKGLSNLEEAVDQSPGVYTMDGQVSIRGGSGFAYGAGSRVMLLWNGMPILSGDAGDAKWNAIPMESASQIEILKGASSVLYGSGALNGIISLNERLPSLKGETRIKIQSGVYGSPKRPTLKWWTSPRIFHQTDAYFGKMYKNVGFTISANGYTNPGYKQGEQEDRARISGTFYLRPKKYDRIKAGIGYNFQYQKTGNFIIWESDTFAYTPSGGADTSFAESTLTYNSGSRLSVDPYVKWHDKKGNKHSLKSRLYSVANLNITNPSQSSNAYVLYGEYQLQRKWGENIVLTSGFTGIRNQVLSNLFGDHYSRNLGLYSQYEYSFH
ncbi:TonB-dependent receptor, partial [Crocinitomicaceae bacterium]|nr:TonB-dependent receptor [Crocinitomicaceae bacterium]